MRTIKVILLFITLLITLLQCTGSTTENKYHDLSDYGIDTEQLSEIYLEAAQIDGIYSLAVSRYGDILIEEYFKGRNAEMTHDVRSVTKSLTSILIGIAIDKGLITGVDEKISRYISPLVQHFDDAKKDITIEHLLTMSAGFEWTPIGDWSEYSNWIESPDQINYIMDKPIISEPGADFNYNDGASHLLSVILSEASGMSAKEFANQHLFNYLGIGDRHWSIDNRGYNLGNVAIRLTTRDMIKLGNLFLYDGIYDSQQLVSKNWIERSTENHIATGIGIEYEKYYGYLWWVYDRGDHPYYFANGYGGQFIVIVPDMELVIAATNNWRVMQNEANSNWYKTISLIIENIIPAIEE